MSSLNSLISEVKDPNDYDGVVFICLKEGRLANIGFTGAIQSGIDQRSFLYRLLMEAGYNVAFPPNGNKAQSRPTHD